MRLALLAAVLATATGCTPPVPPPASAYYAAVQVPPLVLAFAPEADEPAAADAARVLLLGAALPAWVQPELFATGPRTLARARAVRRLLGRPLVVLPAPPLPGQPPDQNLAVLVTRVPGGTVADACLGPGQPVLGDVWPGDDPRRARLLPAGCATATSIQVQVEAAGAGSDLLRGRPLPPGAATPFADAIERYYRRNDPSQRGNAPTGGGADRTGDANASGGDAAPSVQGTAGQGAPGVNPANPLLGPLPGSPAR